MRLMPVSYAITSNAGAGRCRLEAFSESICGLLVCGGARMPRQMQTHCRQQQVASDKEKPDARDVCQPWMFDAKAALFGRR